jgi:hypothetical protein
LMLFLKPVSVPLYGVVSVAAFLVTMQTWELLARYQPYAFLKELAYSMVVPLLYGFFVHRRNRKLAASP